MPTLAAALELMAFPRSSVLPHEAVGLLNIVTRDVDKDVRVTIATMPDELYLAEFVSLERGKGHGRAAMDTICAIADRHGVALGGVVEANEREGVGSGRILTDAELMRWYQTFGFKQVGVHEGRPSVRRKPRR